VQPAVDRLVGLIEKRIWHLSTGFLGCGYLNDVLTKHGRSDVALRLLLNETYPSWLYPVKNGATTIWERWDGWTDQKGFQDPGMNSFNHYAFGAIGEWMVQKVGGLDASRLVDAREVLIAPVIGGGITHASTSLDSIRGRVSVDWKVEGDRVILKFTVPPGVNARVAKPQGTTLGGQTLATGQQGVVAVDDATATFASGTYELAWPR
jgi:alpha-L-rhamnosidase